MTTVQTSNLLLDCAALLMAMDAGVSHGDARRLMQLTAEQCDTPLEEVAELVVSGAVDFGG